MGATLSTGSQSDVRSRPCRSRPSRRDLEKLSLASNQHIRLVSRSRSYRFPSATGLPSCPQETFRIQGTSRHVYTVVIDREPRCDCQDARYNPRHTCKHVIFVFIKVLNVSQSSRVWYQKVLMRSEVVNLLIGEVVPNRSTPRVSPNTTTERRRETPSAPQRQQVTSSVQVSQQRQATSSCRSLLQRVLGYISLPLRTILSAFLSPRLGPFIQQANTPVAVERDNSQASDESCCPICLESFLAGQVQGLVICEGCRNPCHASCLKIWISGTSLANHACVYCRRSWSITEKEAIRLAA
jgi:hypothetical protein